MNNFAKRTAVWKQLIVNDMIQRVRNDEYKDSVQKSSDIEKLRGALGERIAINRMCKALGISQNQYWRRLVKIHTPKPRKPARIVSKAV